jgi:Ca2+-transporting ATPase
MVFTVLISANIFLSLVNRSFYYSIFTTIKYKNKLVPLVIFITILVTALLLYFPPFTHFFGFEKLLFSQLANSIFIGGISVLWIEIFKWYKRKNNP